MLISTITPHKVRGTNKYYFQKIPTTENYLNTQFTESQRKSTRINGHTRKLTERATGRRSLRTSSLGGTELPDPDNGIDILGDNRERNDRQERERSGPEVEALAGTRRARKPDTHWPSYQRAAGCAAAALGRRRRPKGAGRYRATRRPPPPPTTPYSANAPPSTGPDPVRERGPQSRNSTFGDIQAVSFTTTKGFWGLGTRHKGLGDKPATGFGCAEGLVRRAVTAVALLEGLVYLRMGWGW